MKVAGNTACELVPNRVRPRLRISWPSQVGLDVCKVATETVPRCMGVVIGAKGNGRLFDRDWVPDETSHAGGTGVEVLEIEIWMMGI